MTAVVRITEVSPRDGLQNEAAFISTAAKAELVRMLCATGVDEVEVSSFVSAKWIPQLGDAAEVFALLAEDPPHGVMLSALVPNERGLEQALAVNQRAGKALIGKVSVFTAASETFARKNTNASIAETIQRFTALVPRAKAAGLRVRGYVSCIIACPFEGAIAPAAVVDVARRLRDLGVDEIDLGDTIGAADADSLTRLLETYAAEFGAAALSDAERFTLHLHDTFGRAAACARAAYMLGVRSFDAAAGGLGGCPYASTPERRAPGNIDTQTLLRELRSAGASSCVDESKLAHAAAFARRLVGSNP